jgi:hypothetical protein
VASAAGCVVLGASAAAAQSGASASPLETAIACGSSVIGDEASMPHPLHLIGAQDSVARTTFDNRDLLIIDGGTAAGVQIGQEYYVRGGVRLWHMEYIGQPSTPAIRTAGWIRIVAANERTSIAQVIHACGVLLQGDYLEPYKAPEVPAGIDRDDTTGTPDFSAMGHVVSGPGDRFTAAPGEFIRIDRGSEQGVTLGARFAVYRDLAHPGLPLAPIGEIIVVDVGKTQSLARITRAHDAIQTHDYVAPRK